MDKKCNILIDFSTSKPVLSSSDHKARQFFTMESEEYLRLLKKNSAELNEKAHLILRFVNQTLPLAV